MPYDIKRLIFSVSLCAILAVNPVLATAPGEGESVGSAHTVYDGTKLGKVTKGIAGVGYVNSMVDAAGNAAQAAEAHAAAAGASALSAAESADKAHAVLKDKVNIAQGAGNGNKVMVTDGSGDVAPGYITAGMIADGAVTADMLDVAGGLPDTNMSGFLTINPRDNSMHWMGVSTSVIDDGAVTASKLDVPVSSIPYGGTNQSFLFAYETGNSGEGDFVMQWGKVRADGIDDGAVTIEKTSGVVGMVPVGAEGATTYGSFWIE